MSDRKWENPGLVGRMIDELAWVLSPKWANKRRAHRVARQLMEENTERMRGNLRRRSIKQSDPNPNRDERFATEDYEINSLLFEQLVDTQTRSVGLYGENSIAHAAVESRVTYMIGAGLTTKPTVKETKPRDRRGFTIDEETAKAINDVILDTIRTWSDNGVDKSRTMSYPMAQRLMGREYSNEGECFFILGDAPYPDPGTARKKDLVTTCIEFISPRRVETPHEFFDDPDVRLGVRFKKGVAVGYYVRKKHPNTTEIPRFGENENDFDYYERFDKAGNPRMCHIFDPLFAGQIRGLPYLTAAMNKILDFDDYLEAEIIAKQIEACFGLIYKHAETKDPANMWEYAEARATETVNGERMEDIKPGFIDRIGDKDEVEVVDPSRPGPSFPPFAEACIRMVAACANQPYELIAKNFVKTTYSGGRMSVLDGKMGNDMYREPLVARGLKLVYRRIVSTRVFDDECNGLIPIDIFVLNRDYFFTHKYHSKQMGMVDPQKEISAFETGKDIGVLNDDDFHGANGEDWEAQREQRKKERKRDIDEQLDLEQYELEQRESRNLPKPEPESDGDEESPEDRKQRRKELRSIESTITNAVQEANAIN